MERSWRDTTSVVLPRGNSHGLGWKVELGTDRPAADHLGHSRVVFGVHRARLRPLRPI
jgi:hypothetical protein